jgi:multidrug efflux pump
MLCSKVFKTSRHGRFEQIVELTFARLARFYGAVLHGVLNFSSVIVMFGLAVLVCIYYLFTMSQSELAPTEDQSILYVSGRGPETATIEYTRHYAQKIMDVYRSIPEYKESFFMLGFGGAPNTLFGGFKLHPPHTRERSQTEIGKELQFKLSGVAGLEISSFPRASLPGAGRGLPVQFVVMSSAGYAELDENVDELLGVALESGKFGFLQKAVEFTRPKTNIVLDRNRAGAFDIDMEEIGRSLALFLGGNYVNWFNFDGRSYKVIPQVAPEFRTSHDMLQGYYVRGNADRLIPLSSLVSFEQSVEPSDRTQFQQLNSLILQGIPAPGVTIGGAIEYLDKEANRRLPREYSWDYAGMARQYAQQGNALVVTFFVSLIIIYLVLAAQFESWRDPLIILMSVPMSIAGALSFIAWGFGTINIYTQLGLITLIGVIAKNGILIVEFANRLQLHEGLSKREAIEQAAMTRLRPVLMTSVAMVVAMAPLLTASGPGAASRFQMGLVITTGLGIGTFFTLFVVPAYYLFIARDHRLTTSETLPAATGAVPDRPLHVPLSPNLP